MHFLLLRSPEHLAGQATVVHDGPQHSPYVGVDLLLACSHTLDHQLGDVLGLLDGPGLLDLHIVRARRKEVDTLPREESKRAN